MGDMKESLGARSKPDITHTRSVTMKYIGRAGQYGNDKYERGNYQRGDYSAENAGANVERVRQYLRGAVGHLMATLDALELHQAGDPDFKDALGAGRALCVPDDEDGLTFRASGLPHLAHGACSLNFALRIAELAGLIPSDPGAPWREQPATASPANAESGDRCYAFESHVVGPRCQPRLGGAFHTMKGAFNAAKATRTSVWRHNSTGLLVELVWINPEDTGLESEAAVDLTGCTD